MSEKMDREKESRINKMLVGKYLHKKQEPKINDFIRFKRKYRNFFIGNSKEKSIRKKYNHYIKWLYNNNLLRNGIKYKYVATTLRKLFYNKTSTTTAIKTIERYIEKHKDKTFKYISIGSIIMFSVIGAYIYIGNKLYNESEVI